MMRQKQIKFVVGSTLIVLAIGFLIGSSIDSTSKYFMTVEELDSQGASNYFGTGLKVKGNIVPGSIKRDPKNFLDVAFSIQENKSLLPVKYNGVTPDMFGDGREVVVEGTLDTSGTFHANTVLTSCPSKYEAEKEQGKTHPGGTLPNYDMEQKQELSPASLPKA